MTGEHKALRRQCTWAARWDSPPTKGARHSRSGFLTRAGRPKTATLATSSTPGGRAMQRRGRPQASTHDGVGAMTAERTARRCRNPREPACLARRSARRAFLNTSASPRRSTNTWGRRTPRMAQRLSPSVPAGRSHHRRGHHPQPAATPRRLGADMARASAGQPDPQLGRSSSHLRGELPRDVCAP
jgi:hypothetical protein